MPAIETKKQKRALRTLRHATVTHGGSRFSEFPLPEGFAVFGAFIGNETNNNQSDY